MGLVILVVGGDGTLGQFANLPDGVGAALGTLANPMPKVGLQIVHRGCVIQTRAVILRPMLFGRIYTTKNVAASNCG